MADETKVAVSTEGTQAADAAAQPTKVTTPADATGAAQSGNSGTSDRTFTQADVDRIVSERLERANEKAKKDSAKAQAEAEAKVLAEQGKYKELFEKQQAELDTERKARRDSELRLMQRDIAAKTSLPLEFAERLRGETEEEMLADAKRMLAAMPKPPAPNINAQSGAGGAPATGQMSDAEKRELAARLGVNPKYMS